MLKSISDAALATIYLGVVPFVAADFIKPILMVLIQATVPWRP